METLFDTPAAPVTAAPTAISQDAPAKAEEPRAAAPQLVGTGNKPRICANCADCMAWGGEGDNPAGWVCYGCGFQNQDRGVPPAVDPNDMRPCFRA